MSDQIRWQTGSRVLASAGRNRNGSVALGLSILLCITHPSQVAGQSGFPISVSVGTHALTVPWYVHPVTDRLNPAVMVGTDRSLRAGEHWSVSFGMSVGLSQDHWWMSGVSLEPELRVGRRLPVGFEADLGLGLGYMHYFWRRKTLELEDGRYVEATNWGRPSLILPLSVTLAYRGDPARPAPVSPFVSARWAVQGLFLEEIPAATHLFLLAGIRIHRGRDSRVGGK